MAVHFVVAGLLGIITMLVLLVIIPALLPKTTRNWLASVLAYLVIGWVAISVSLLFGVMWFLVLT